uniref:NADH dehydrogenase subunit 3 n=1 Tax=Cycetogamasus diviortus TaxID=2978624 RepID=UPI0022F2C8BD|nr:NADH dehydrogenase subunit 3 [Cycetogamasus diviortus]WAK85127.1 NADH dehydrogenase subunit 3 [Cycetogamasus diviortus]
MKFTLLAVILSLIVMMASFFLSKKSFSDKEKTTPFECGFDPYLMTRSPFSLRFFKIAIIFLIFDIEIVLILPLPLINSSNNSLYMISSICVIIIILAGLLYEWQQGSLDWVK